MSTSGSGNATASSRRKNASGSRNDIGWEYGIEVGHDAKKVQCKFCAKISSGGIYCFKHHLACTNDNVGACRSVPDDVRKRMLEILSQGMEAKERKSNMLLRQHEIGSSLCISVKGKKSSTQVTMNELFKKDLRKSACRSTGRWLYTCGIPFNTVRSPEFTKMFEEVARHGPGFKAPSYHEVRETMLTEEVKETRDYIEIHKAEWRKVGCSIMSDGWTDKKRRTICNFLVNSPGGTVFLESLDTSDFSKTAQIFFEMLNRVVEEVGEENVVQVITDNDASYKAAGSLLMEKRKHLFWTPCAAHCIDLMLEDFEKKLKVHRVTIKQGRKITTYIYSRTLLISMLKQFTEGRDLIRPAVTRFATTYLTLGCLSEYKGALMTMFSSSKWKESKFVRTEEGKGVENIVLDSRFWGDVGICLKAALPLMKVFRLVDSDEQAAMPFLYEEMDCAKEKIQANFNNVARSYTPIWKIINERWTKQLHRPLYAAAHYLNPRIHYRPSFNPNDKEVKNGLFDSLDTLVKERNERNTIISQLDIVHHGQGMFSRIDARDLLEKKHPDDWWNTYGDDVPELQRFAIRVLSLTCSSSGCERNCSAFEMVHTKKMNRLHQKKMNDLVFVMYNSKLKNKKFRSMELSTFEDIGSDNEWTTEGGVDVPSPNEDVNAQIVEPVGNDGIHDMTIELDSNPIEDEDIEEIVNMEEGEGDEYNGSDGGGSGEDDDLDDLC
ncbi:uncharacterized protein LOC120007275 [Tripterygium wilfordii]|uniref:uncharacterized protein LOC120007275 n=1 Tax=Tripterygium wilfordii TaxID=458696 RepID=UPI0018F7F477|nr:uncharacterized protein LOC120007275 [Tripterygium wilfordii]